MTWITEFVFRYPNPTILHWIWEAEISHTASIVWWFFVPSSSFLLQYPSSWLRIVSKHPTACNCSGSWADLKDRLVSASTMAKFPFQILMQPQPCCESWAWGSGSAAWPQPSKLVEPEQVLEVRPTGNQPHSTSQSGFCRCCWLQWALAPLAPSHRRCPRTRWAESNWTFSWWCYSPILLQISDHDEVSNKLSWRSSPAACQEVRGVVRLAGSDDHLDCLIRLLEEVAFVGFHLKFLCPEFVLFLLHHCLQGHRSRTRLWLSTSYLFLWFKRKQRKILCFTIFTIFISYLLLYNVLFLR